MMNKKVTRKQFLLSALSIVALFMVNKVPSVDKDSSKEKVEGGHYGNRSYGGSRNNA